MARFHETLYPIKRTYGHAEGPHDLALQTKEKTFRSADTSEERVELAGVDPPWYGDVAADDTLQPRIRNQLFHRAGQADLERLKVPPHTPGIKWRASLPTNRGIVIGSPPFSILSTRPSMNTPSTSTPAPVVFPAALTQEAMT